MDVNERFFALAARKFSGEATEVELDELRKLLSENPDWQWRFDNLKSYWESKNDVVSDLDAAYKKVKLRTNAGIPIGPASETLIESIAIDTNKRKNKLLLRLAVAASIAAFLVVGYMVYKQGRSFSAEPVLAKHELLLKHNPKGNTSVVYLSDSTKVILNADSKLEFPERFNGAVREVYLTGEAYFDVKHDDEKPFIIHAGRMNIKVLGTEFNVRSYPDDSTSEASLIRGMIEVTLTDRPADKIILKPSEKIVVSNDSDLREMNGLTDSSSVKEARLLISKLHYVSPSDSSVLETVWIDNRIIFKDETFYRLAKDLERRYDVNIRFQNEKVRDLRFTGAFEKESLAEILDALKLTERFYYTIKKDSILIH